MSATPAQITPQILYIDDDPSNRTLVNRLLTNYNFYVVEAGNGMEGLQIARKTFPDLVLMDINMPGLDGHETTTRMRSIAGLQDIPIVAVTANTTTQARMLALAAGCNGYITKPIDIDKFPLQVMAYLEGHKDTLSKDEQQQYLGQYSQKLVERLESKILELEDANSRLQKIDKLKSDFITIAAHEFRTPITLVYGYARLMQVELQELGQTQAFESISDLADRIYNSVRRLSDVVNDLLNISLIEANEMRIMHQDVNLKEIIQAALATLDLKKNDRQLTIEMENLDNLPPITGDAQRLQQAFWNILSNAVKFTPDEGSILINTWVAHSPESPRNADDSAPAKQTQEGGVVVMVKDSGIGIAASEQKEIFDRFYVAGDTAYHSSSKTAFKGGGMGLGLPIARGIIEAHGGRIWVESDGRDTVNNPGSTFYVLLPYKTDDP